MPGRRLSLLCAAACAAAAMTAQARSVPAEPRAAAETPFRLAVNMTTVESLPVFLAAQGRPVVVSAGGIPRLLDGTAEAATNSETQALLRSVAEPGLRIVLTVAECFYRLVGRRSAGIERVSDLRGKKIGTPANTSSHYYLALMLARAKLTEADVTVVPMAVNLMGAAMKKGEVDAVSGWEPGAQDAIDALGRDAVVFQERSVYRELFNLNTTIAVLNDQARRRALVQVVRGIIVASEQVRAHPSDGWPMLSSNIKMPVPTISAVWRHFRFAGGLPGDLLDVLVNEERWVAAGQHRQPRDRAALQTLVDPSVLRDARLPFR